MMGVTADQAAQSVGSAASRVVALARSGLDPSARVSGLDWTVHELVAHLASGATAYREIAEGAPSVYPSIEARTAVNQQRLQEFVGSDLDALAAMVESDVARMLAAVRERRDKAMAWHGGVVLPTTAFLGALVGELLFHGLDLARTARCPWPIDRADVLPAVDFFNAATPFVVSASAAGVSATIEVRYRGYDPATFRFVEGVLTVSPGQSRRADVRLSVDPLSFLLIGYRRRSLARAVATGGAVAWGRRPWLAFRFPRFFDAP
jgi:uncharacterized protein (TIGR03083 family)